MARMREAHETDTRRRHTQMHRVQDCATAGGLEGLDSRFKASKNKTDSKGDPIVNEKR